MSIKDGIKFGMGFAIGKLIVDAICGVIVKFADDETKTSETSDKQDKHSEEE